MKSPVILIILDGWGIAPPSPSNAIALANTPFMDKLEKTYPFMLLDSGGQTVGLPWGTTGNSEVGHSIIGAGRVIYQDLSRINQAILDGSFFNNQAFLKAIERTKKQNSKLHLVGMVSGAGGHSCDEHLYSLLELVKKKGLAKVFIHAILDGRDSSYNSGLQYISDLSKEIKRKGVGRIATISGRYFAMDRDKHWDRIEKAYRAMADGIADYYYNDPVKAVKDRYSKSNYDEEFIPSVIVDERKAPIAKISANDSVIIFNFRSDRVRQLTKAFVLEDFKDFNRSFISDLCVATMTQYDLGLPVLVAFPPDIINDSLSEVISKAGLRQLHIAETEKYAHVTYFFGGGSEKPWPGQDNVLVPSPRVSSYDQKPEMSVLEMTGKIVEALESKKYDFIAVNFANADMVGHTGNFKATVKAVEMLDKCIQQIVTSVLEHNGKALITADHGNAEQMLNEDGELDKEHSDNSVPLIMAAKEFKNIKFSETGKVFGALYDVAPTIIELFDLPKSDLMTGKPLLSYLERPISIKYVLNKDNSPDGGQKSKFSFLHFLKKIIQWK